MGGAFVGRRKLRLLFDKDCRHRRLHRLAGSCRRTTQHYETRWWIGWRFTPGIRQRKVRRRGTQRIGAHNEFFRRQRRFVLSKRIDLAIPFRQRRQFQPCARRYRVFGATVARAFQRIEHRDHAVVIARRKRLELVIVTTRATKRETKERQRTRADDVVELIEPIGRRIGGLVVPMSEPEVAGSDHGLGGRLRHFVPCQLFDDELVERLVGVQRVDHVIAIPPDKRLLGIALVAVAVGVTHDIQPVPGPAFTISWSRQEFVNDRVERLR